MKLRLPKGMQFHNRFVFEISDAAGARLCLRSINRHGLSVGDNEGADLCRFFHTGGDLPTVKI